MKFVRFVLTWVARLPARFTAILVTLLLGYLFLVSRVVGPHDVEAMAGYLLGLLRLPAVVADGALVELGTVGIVVLLLLAVGVLLSYNGAAVAYRWIRKRPSIRVVDSPEPGPGEGGRLDRFKKIGVILAGGGAKGAYQAGSLKAIHEFLEDNGALDRVKMIAGTSIGSWNAMFWLAGLVKAPAGGRSTHEMWWRSIGLERIVEFDTYWPLRRNHFLRSTPWQETFDEIFLETDEVKERLARLFSGNGSDPPVHFYLTRSNVELGHLEFATNRADLRGLTRPRLGGGDEHATEPVVKPDRYEIIDHAEPRDCLERTRRAVFASMDLPPLFPYMKIRVDRNEWFEDGGVVNNLPVHFGTQLEECDLLFVLPLNASFAEPVDHTSVTKRMFRVMDVRQGVMERTSLKMVYLYNELASLRKEVRKADAGTSSPTDALQRTALRREHERVSVFAIVPEAPLAIQTQEFWKPDAAGEAFDLMYEATKMELAENFERDTNPSWIRMTLVSPLGERTYFDDF